MEIEGFTGVGHSIEDGIYQAKWGMKDHVELLTERGFPVPAHNPNPTIIIRNQSELAAA